MSNDLKISRELAERLVKGTPRSNWDALDDDRLAATEELRALLAAPAVERQEPVAWLYHGVSYSVQPHSEATPLFTSQPAPVSVVLPDNLESHRNTWVKALERLVELEPASCAPDEDEKGFWRHELQAMRDMYTDLDKIKELNK